MGVALSAEAEIAKWASEMKSMGLGEVLEEGKNFVRFVDGGERGARDVVLAGG